MMSRRTIEAAIGAVISGVSGVGTVHLYNRWAKEWGKFLELVGTETAGGKNLIRGVMLSRERISKLHDHTGEILLGYIYVIRFFRGLQDAEASERDFQDMIDLVEAAFDVDETLGGTCLHTHPEFGALDGAVGLRVDAIEPRIFGTVLCHYAEARICPVISREV